MIRTSARASHRGQTLVETALVLPLFITIVAGIIVFGIGLFYQQQVETAAREAARYAAIHSATSDCPTSSWKAPNEARLPEGATLTSPQDCDPPPNWPNMTEHARRLTFGLDSEALHVRACWSGYVDTETTAYDAGAVNPNTGDPNDWDECTIGGSYPLTETADLACPPPLTSDSDDRASNLAWSADVATVNRVSVFTCYQWSPPLAGLLLIPETVTFRAAISEVLQHQR